MVESKGAKGWDAMLRLAAEIDGGSYLKTLAAPSQQGSRSGR